MHSKSLTINSVKSLYTVKLTATKVRSELTFESKGAQVHAQVECYVVQCVCVCVCARMCVYVCICVCVHMCVCVCVHVLTSQLTTHCIIFKMPIELTFE